MGQVAFVFAGQGAQYPGMGKALYESSAAARAVFDRCERIRPGTLAQCFSGTPEDLARTVNTQPCLFAMDLACAAALKDAGIAPQGAAGFSLGEVAAVAFCGMLSLEDAFRLVVRRGEMMDACAQANPGGMAAVLRMERAALEEVCATLEGVYPVNYNAPGQIAVAGTTAGLEALGQAVAERRGRVIPLAVSGAFHSPMMGEASQGLAQMLAGLDWKAGDLPLYANRTAQPYTLDEGKQTLAEQVQCPVRWQTTVENMVQAGFDTFLEVGAGKTLTGLIRKIDSTVWTHQAETPQDIREIQDTWEERHANG